MKITQFAVLGLSALVLAACQSGAGVANAQLETGKYTCQIQGAQAAEEATLIITLVTHEAVELLVKDREAESKLAFSKAKTGAFVNIDEEMALIPEANGKFKMYEAVAANNADGYELVTMNGTAICQK